MSDEEKWHFCPDHECPYCEQVIPDSMVKKDRVITGCPLCKRSFVE